MLSSASISLMTGWAMKFKRIGLIVASLYLGDVEMMLLRRWSKVYEGVSDFWPWEGVGKFDMVVV